MFGRGMGERPWAVVCAAVCVTVMPRGRPGEGASLLAHPVRPGDDVLRRRATNEAEDRPQVHGRCEPPQPQPGA